PKDWSGLQFKIYFLNRAMNIDLSANKVKIVNLSAEHVDFHYKGKKILLPAKECFISELT
ncbi:MAG TPA: glycosyl hydrolase family 65 protein, partial [Saprospiraceae bacterium]|nr:glycosyl hydrolase family 65 protein [Saprospiraceae bacterium]